MPDVERSPTSYGSSMSMGAPAAASFSSAALPPAVLASAPSMEAEGPEAVERSGGSLLNWSRPPGRKPAGSHLAGSSSPGSRGSSAGVRPGWTPQVAEAPNATEAPDAEQHSSRGAGIRSFLRSAKSSPCSSARASRSGAAAACGLPAAASARSPSQLAVAGNAEGPLPPAPDGAAAHNRNNSDLHSSVRNWQRQQGGDEACEPSAQSFSQQEGLAVDGRSDSLLQWRLPPRAGSGRQAAAGLQPAPPAGAASGASPPRIGSASLRRTLSNFKQKLFGGDVPVAEPPKQAAQQQQQQQLGVGPDWSIAAVRAQPAAPGSQDTPALSSIASGPRLAVAVALNGAQVAEQPDGAESPGKAAERLNRLRQMADRRRVWSAPLKAPEQADGSADGPSAASGAPAAGAEVAAVSVTGQRPPSGQRPGLQVLKARARTARLMSGSSSSVAGQASSSLYSMEAVNDVFGPDQPVPSSPWSPLKAAPGSPPKVRRCCAVFVV